jgi:hypothetical protein
MVPNSIYIHIEGMGRIPIWVLPLKIVPDDIREQKFQTLQKDQNFPHPATHHEQYLSTSAACRWMLLRSLSYLRASTTP